MTQDERDLLGHLNHRAAAGGHGVNLGSMKPAEITDRLLGDATPPLSPSVIEAGVTDAMKRVGAFAGAAYGFPNLYHPDGEMLEEIYLAMQAADPAWVEPPEASQAEPLVPNAVRLSPNERKVLLGMWSLHHCDYDDICGDGASWYNNFRTIGSESKIERSLVRRTVRALKRKGLADYSNMLMSEDGDMLGAGYGLTRKGRELAAAEAGDAQGQSA